MNEKLYEVIDYIEKTDLKNRLFKTKQEINKNILIRNIISSFNETKDLYEKYSNDDEFLKAKISLMKEPIIKEYLDIQNEINMLSLYINNKIKQITNTTKNK